MGSIRWILELGEWFWRLFQNKKPSPAELDAANRLRLPDAKHRVLIVEDNPNDAELLSILLKDLGMECTIVYTCEGASALIARNSISIAFIDMRFPQMAGWDLIPLFWKHSPETLVVALCAERSDIMRIKYPFRYIVLMEKPPELDTLRDMLSHFKLKAL